MKKILLVIALLVLGLTAYSQGSPTVHDERNSKELHRKVIQDKWSVGCSGNEELVELSFSLKIYNNRYCIYPRLVLNNIAKDSIKFISLTIQLRDPRNSIPFYCNENNKVVVGTNSWADESLHRDDINNNEDYLICEKTHNEPRFYIDNSNIEKDIWINVNECFIVMKGGKKILNFIGKDQPELFKLIKENKQIKSEHVDLIRHGDKEYNGDFTISGVGFRSNGKKVGTAKYEYRDAPDGTRIFEGNFHYSYQTITNGGTIKISDEVNGVYLNNKQIGTWRWVSEQIEGRVLSADKEEIETMTIDFSNDGKIESFSYSLGWQNSISGDFVNGILKRLSYRKKTDRVTAQGNYSTTEFGVPVGKWTITGEVPNGSVTIEYDNRGNVVSAVYYDPQTGDKIRVPEWICRYPRTIFSKVIGLVSNYCYRNTEKPRYY